MRVFTKYLGVERQTYEFSEADLTKILLTHAMKEFHLSPKPEQRVELELGETGATLTIVYETVVQEGQ